MSKSHPGALLAKTTDTKGLVSVSLTPVSSDGAGIGVVRQLPASSPLTQRVGGLHTQAILLQQNKTIIG